MKLLDIYLLGTFLMCYIASDNLMRLPELKHLLFQWLNTPYSIFLSAVGLGTMIASLANLISFKRYIRQYPAFAYKKEFMHINFTMLVILICCLSPFLI